MSKDVASPATTAIAADLMNQAIRRAVVPGRAKGAVQILKGQAVPDKVRGALPMLPTANNINSTQAGQPISILDRVKGAAAYAMMGDPRAFFPPGYPLLPQAPAVAAGRQFDYPFYYNVQIQPRAYESVSFDLLRSMSESHDLLRTVIESAKNRIAFQEWSFMSADEEQKKGGKKNVPAGTQDRMKWATNFFRRPNMREPFAVWAKALIEDMLTIDAMSVYNKPTLSGSPHSFEYLDGATVNVKLDYWGHEPDAPETAYQQILKGLPALDYTSDDIVYMPFNRRTHKAYGYSPVEQIMVTINIAIRRQWWQLQKYVSGAHTPYLIKTPPDWSPDQIDAAQQWYNTQFVDNMAQKWRAILLPNGCEPLTMGIKDIDEKGDMDDWLAGLICYAFSVDRSELIKPMNRASAQHGGAQADKEGFAPFSQFFEQSMNELVYRCFGYEDIRFKWRQEEDMFTQEKSAAIQIYANIGCLMIDETRELLGMDPLDGGAGQQFVLAANAQVLKIDDVNSLSDQNDQAQEMHDAAVQQANNPTGPNGTTAGAGSSGTKGQGSGSGGQKANAGSGANAGKSSSKTAKAFDVAPSPVSGLQPYGGNNRSRTMMHARGTKRANPKRKRNITRQFSLKLREPSDERVKRLKDAVAVKLKAKGKEVAQAVTHRLRKFEKAGDPKRIVHSFMIKDLLAKDWEDLAKSVGPILEDASADTATELIASAGLVPTEQQWDMVDQATTDLAYDRAAELVGMRYNPDGDLVPNPNAKWAITEDARDELTNLVAKAEAENWSNDDLSEAIQKASLFSEDRADMIARTELKRIDAMASGATASATGATSKQWLLSSDHNDRDDCDQNAAAQWIDIEEDFPSGVELPPDHPNCQCVVTFGWEDQDD